MTPDHIKQLKETTDLVKELHTAVVGQPEYNRPGLVHEISALKDSVRDLKAAEESTKVKVAKWSGVIIGAGATAELAKMMLKIIKPDLPL